MTYLPECSQYLWARANPHARVSLFGLVTIPAPYLPYAYLGLDLIRGGPGLAIQSATGIVAGHAWYFVNDILPAQNGGRRILSAPQFLRNLLPDSVDPALEGQRPATGEGGSSRTTGFGTAFAPRGRGFGDGGTSSGSPAGQGNTLQGSSGGGVQGWLGRLGSAGWLTGNGNASASSVGGGAGPSREAILAAAERRLREQRASSVTGRQGARTPWTNTAPAGGTLGNRDSGATGASTGMSEAIRRSGAGSMTRGPGTFSQLQQASEKPREETASSSGGSVAEQRKPTPAEDQSAARGGQDSVKHQWGTGGNRLGS